MEGVIISICTDRLIVDVSGNVFSETLPPWKVSETSSGDALWWCAVLPHAFWDRKAFVDKYKSDMNFRNEVDGIRSAIVMAVLEGVMPLLTDDELDATRAQCRTQSTRTRSL